MRIRNCPAAVIGNERDNTHWFAGKRSHSRWHLRCRVRESEDLPPHHIRGCGGSTASWDMAVAATVVGSTCPHIPACDYGFVDERW